MEMPWPHFLIVVAGFVMVVEGIPWFLSPLRMKLWLRQLLGMPEGTLRFFGLTLMLGGLLLVYLGHG